MLVCLYVLCLYACMLHNLLCHSRKHIFYIRWNVCVAVTYNITVERKIILIGKDEPIRRVHGMVWYGIV